LFCKFVSFFLTQVQSGFQNKKHFLPVVLLLALDANGSEREHGEESEVPDDELKPERVVDLRSCRELVHEAEDAVHERDSERLPLVVDERHDWRAHDRRPHRESAVENYLFIVKVVENKYDRWGLMTVVSSQMFILLFSKEGWTVNTTVLKPIETTNKTQNITSIRTPCISKLLLISRIKLLRRGTSHHGA